MVNDLGYYSSTMNLGLLEEMRVMAFAIMFMELIFDIIVILFVSISILLIYSLLTISIEQKSFEIGVMRMVGLSNHGLIFMVLLQAFMFVVPAIIIGFIASYPLLSLVNYFMKASSLDIQNLAPPASAIIEALMIGIIVPAISSILPI